MPQCLNEAYPEYYDAVISQWERSTRNWIVFHNQFTKNNVTHILSLRESGIANLAVRGVPNAKIAEQFNISVGRLNNIMHEIYQKLYISGRKELSELIK
jgi:DNA-binding CsgD family transcriptional regulator